MQALSGRDLVAVWESGLHASSAERALAILAACLPEARPDDLAALPIGERDRLLVAVHTATFGQDFQAQISCAACGQALEFCLPLTSVGRLPDAPFEPGREFQVNDVVVEYRLPDSRDLAAIAELSDLAEARSALGSRCVLAVSPEGEALSEPVLSALAEEMARQQPWADIAVDLTCPACNQRWQAPFDPATFVWSEIAAEARRLLREVHRLASAYGWREADILSMSTPRRHAYLELVG
jgi:hypothetical protein